MNSINRLLTAIKSLFTKRGNNVEGTENKADALPVNNQSADNPAIQPEPGSAVNTAAADEVTAPAVNAPVGTQTTQPAPAAPAVISNEPVDVGSEASSISTGLLTDVKTLLKVAGHDVEAVWDDAVAYAQKVAQEEAELAEKLVSVLRVAGHDVGDIISDAFSFARKHGKS